VIAVTDVFATTVDEFVNSVVGALPAILSGVLFLVIAYVLIRAVRYALRSALEGVYPTDQRLIVDFGVLVVTIFMWFAAGLVFLKVVGMGDIAASLGTAAGFVALGISYALSEMVADTVAGVYLLKDPDFNPGDTVTAAGTTGTVTAIDLRKSRFELESGDTAILANRQVESNWTVERPDGEAEPADDGSA